MRPARRTAPLLAPAALLLVVTAPPAGAQPRPGCGIVGGPVWTPPGSCPEPSPASPWRTQGGYAVANAALGGVTAAVARGIATRSWRAAASAFAAGAAGGAGVYAGKLAAAQRFDGAGLAGRQLAAVGASVVRDAGAGRAPFSRLVLPLGPVRLYVGDDAPGAAGRRTVRARLDLATLAGAVDAARQPGARFDLRGSLSAGALAFVTRPPAAVVCELACAEGGDADASGEVRLGYALGGTLWVLDRSGEASVPPGAVARTRAHEQVHLVQYDAGHTLWALDGERRLFAAFGRPGRRLGAWLDLGLHAGAIGLANQAIPYRRRPWEREAHALAGSGATGGH